MGEIRATTPTTTMDEAMKKKITTTTPLKPEDLPSGKTHNAALTHSSNNTGKLTEEGGKRKKKSVGGGKISSAAITTKKVTIEDETHIRDMHRMLKAAFPQGNEELERELFPSGAQLHTITAAATKGLDFATNYECGKPHMTRESWQVDKKVMRKTSRCFNPATRERSLGFRRGCQARNLHRMATYSETYP